MSCAILLNLVKPVSQETQPLILQKKFFLNLKKEKTGYFLHVNHLNIDNFIRQGLFEAKRGQD